MGYTLAVISDIHANLPALEAVIADINQNFQEVSEIVCPGDLVGYGPHPRETLDLLLAETRITTITKGNHDHAVGGLGRDKYFDNYLMKFNEYAKAAIQWQCEVLNAEEKTFLYQLPNSRTCLHSAYEARIAIIHGSPEYPLDEYILPNTHQQKDLFPFLELFELNLLFLGHTHIPFIDTAKSESGRELLICNPGSVGQPRDREPRASYAVVDVENLEIEIIRVEYDIDKTFRDIKDKGLPDFLGERLLKGV